MTRMANWGHYNLFYFQHCVLLWKLLTPNSIEHGSVVAISRAGTFNFLWTERRAYKSPPPHLNSLNWLTCFNKVTLLADISQALNTPAKSMQGANGNSLTCSDKINSFKDKLTLWPGWIKNRKLKCITLQTGQKSCWFNSTKFAKFFYQSMKYFKQKLYRKMQHTCHDLVLFFLPCLKWIPMVCIHFLTCILNNILPNKHRLLNQKWCSEHVKITEVLYSWFQLNWA
jgi:hypothetical protein